VTLLEFPLQYTKSDKVAANDINYYAPRTNPEGPAMTWSMYAIDYLMLNQTETAAKSFNFSYKPYIHEPYYVWWETITGGAANFITGAGGFLQAILFGYGGIRLQENEMQFNPQLMQTTKSVKFRQINYLGSQLEFSFDANQMCFTLLKQSGQKSCPVLNTSSGPIELIEYDMVCMEIGLVSLTDQCK